MRPRGVTKCLCSLASCSAGRGAGELRALVWWGRECRHRECIQPYNKPVERGRQSLQPCVGLLSAFALLKPATVWQLLKRRQHAVCAPRGKEGQRSRMILETSHAQRNCGICVYP